MRLAGQASRMRWPRSRRRAACRDATSISARWRWRRSTAMTRPIDPRRRAAAPRPAPRAERQVAFRLGLSAETRAAAMLLAKGFRIVARRWRSPVGEIDLVARRGRLLVFVEVKA